MKLPWYKDGLHFKCTECGGCCTGSPGYIWVSEEEIKAIAEHLSLPLDTFKKNYLLFKDGRYSLIEKRNSNYDCIFLEGKRCTIYPVRPTQCRTFPWWPGNLESPESWKHAATYCEGINDNAPLVPFEEISAFINHRG